LFTGHHNPSMAVDTQMIWHIQYCLPPRTPENCHDQRIEPGKYIEIDERRGVYFDHYDKTTRCIHVNCRHDTESPNQYLFVFPNGFPRDKFPSLVEFCRRTITYPLTKRGSSYDPFFAAGDVLFRTIKASRRVANDAHATHFMPGKAYSVDPPALEEPKQEEATPSEAAPPSEAKDMRRRKEVEPIAFMPPTEDVVLPPLTEVRPIVFAQTATLPADIPGEVWTEVLTDVLIDT